jgi:hypothetical protein
VRVPPLPTPAPATPPGAPAAIAPASVPPSPSVAPPHPPPRSAKARRIAGIVLGGTGAAALMTGAVFGVLSLVARDDARQWCSDVTNVCTAKEGVDARSAAILRGNVATGLIAGGAALLSAGLVLWLTAPRDRARVAVGLRAVDGSGVLAGIAARGEF